MADAPMGSVALASTAGQKDARGRAGGGFPTPRAKRRAYGPRSPLSMPICDMSWRCIFLLPARPFIIFLLDS